LLDFCLTSRKGEKPLTTQVTTEKPKTQTVVSGLLTVSEVGTLLRVDDTTVRRWVKNGVLEAVSLPHVGLRQAYRIKRETVDKLLETPQTNVQNVPNERHVTTEE